MWEILPGRDEMGWIGWAAGLLKLLDAGLHYCYWDAPAANLLFEFLQIENEKKRPGAYGRNLGNIKIIPRS